MLHKASTKCFQVPTTATCANTKSYYFFDISSHSPNGGSYFFDISAVTLAILPMEGGDLSTVVDIRDLGYTVSDKSASSVCLIPRPGELTSSDLSCQHALLWLVGLAVSNISPSPTEFLLLDVQTRRALAGPHNAGTSSA